jgi:hypothetical protein
MLATTFRALGSEVRIEADETLESAIEAVFGTFPRSSGAADLDYGIDRGGEGFRLWRGNECLRESPEGLDMVACLEGDLIEQATARASGWVLHAAGVAGPGGAVVLAGESGAGKSTMALALVGAGRSYLSDERIEVGSALSVRGLARPIAISGELAAPLPKTARLLAYPTARPGPTVPRLAHLPPEQICGDPVPLRLLVRLRHAPSEEPRARKLSADEALSLLWPNTVGPGAKGWATALEAVKRIEAVELVTRSVPESLRALELLVG